VRVCLYECVCDVMGCAYTCVRACSGYMHSFDDQLSTLFV